MLIDTFIDEPVMLTRPQVTKYQHQDIYPKIKAKTSTVKSQMNQHGYYTSSGIISIGKTVNKNIHHHCHRHHHHQHRSHHQRMILLLLLLTQQSSTNVISKLF